VIKFKNYRLFYLDQTLLPQKEVYRECITVRDGFKAIKSLQVRGAPLIGIFSAYCIYVSLKKFSSKSKLLFFNRLNKNIEYLKSCRPTAVNLSWALERIKTVASRNKEKSIEEIKQLILKEAQAIHRQDIEICRKMVDNGIKLIKDNDKILTHCNSGQLATGGEGTALGIICRAAKIYKNIKVYIDETRPLLQGARLTAWELIKKKVNAVLICDNMAGYLMQKGEVDKVIVGADRITRRGDVANKIGTYSLAVLSHYHKIPFYVAAPFSSFDLSIEKGEDIPIEEREGEEVKKVLGKVEIAPKEIRPYNPAFDVTPHNLISGIITEKGTIYPPFEENIKKYFSCRGE